MVSKGHVFVVSSLIYSLWRLVGCILIFLSTFEGERGL